MKFRFLSFCLLSAAFQCQTAITASPSADAGIGDIPAAILNLLLSPGIQITHFDISLSTLSLLLNTATLNFDALSPLPLVELTIDQISAELGTNGTPFFSFNQTFTNFVLPGLSSANSGTVQNVVLNQGGLGTLNVLSDTEFDMMQASYSLRVLTVNGTGGIPITLPATELDVPTNVSFNVV